MALYDAKEKKKISENFYFDMNNVSVFKSVENVRVDGRIYLERLITHSTNGSEIVSMLEIFLGFKRFSKKDSRWQLRYTLEWNMWNLNVIEPFNLVTKIL